MDVLKEKSFIIMPSRTLLSIDQKQVKENFFTTLLPHPKTNKKVLFFLKEAEEKNELFEINKYEDNPSSWFVNSNSIQSDGSLLIATPFDPLFIFLSYLIQDKSGKYLLPEQLIPNSVDVCNVGLKLLKCLNSQHQLKNIADVVGDDSYTAYRYNESKTLNWLDCKVKRLTSKLKTTNIFIAEQENLSSDDSVLYYSCCLICDYLPDSLQTILKQHLGIKENSSKRCISQTLPSSKKIKNEPIDDYSLLAVKTDAISNKKFVTRAQKTLNKVDKKGMKTMSSFFKPKPKNKK